MTEQKKEQFKKLNEKHPDCLKLFRLGDFYESYQEDAEETARITGVNLKAKSHTPIITFSGGHPQTVSQRLKR